MTCAVQVQVQVETQSGLKYNNLCGKCPERIHLHRVTRQQQY